MNFATWCMGPMVRLGKLIGAPEGVFILTLTVAGVRLGLMTEIPVRWNSELLPKIRTDG
jgi:hypothetical protein